LNCYGRSACGRGGKTRRIDLMGYVQKENKFILNERKITHKSLQRFGKAKFFLSQHTHTQLHQQQQRER
jgi:hypothetical protein